MLRLANQLEMCMSDTGPAPGENEINQNVTAANIAFHAAASTVAWIDRTARALEKEKLNELVNANPEAAKQAMQDLEKNRGLYPGSDTALSISRKLQGR